MTTPRDELAEVVAAITAGLGDALESAVMPLADSIAKLQTETGELRANLEAVVNRIESVNRLVLSDEFARAVRDKAWHG